MAKKKTISVTNALEIERALKPGERRRVLDSADFLLQKGGRSKIRQGMEASKAYLEHERPQDNEKWRSPALFLTAGTIAHGKGRLTVRAINQICDGICAAARVEGKTPHSARHAMGVNIMKRFGN